MNQYCKQYKIFNKSKSAQLILLNFQKLLTDLPMYKGSVITEIVAIIKIWLKKTLNKSLV